MTTQVITLSADLQKRILSALRVAQLNLVDFPELRKRGSSARLIIDEADFTQEELALFAQIKRPIPFQRHTGQVTLTKATKIALLRACQLGWLNPTEIPELIRAQQSLKRDFSALPIQQLRILAKINRLRKNDSMLTIKSEPS